MGNTEVCQVIDKLAAPWKIAAERNFDIGKRVAQSDQAIAQKIDTQKIGVGQNFDAWGALEIEGAGTTGLAA
ncbi:MAG: hypothetical protein JOZ60_10990 [Verrucomicrobia bacterium]|nr:hypothetical protein [Verrucomicrobiota bacterium]